MTEEMKFFIYLIECYACEKGRPTGEILDNYEQYHQERIENAYEDIDSLLEYGVHAW